MDLSIIVVNLNTRSLLADALSALPRACGGLAPAARGQAFETIVIDNGSTDGSPALVRERFPDARLIVNDRNVGFAKANNQAMRLARGDRLLLLNSDACAAPGSITALDRFVRAHPRAGIAGPRLVNADGTFQGSAADFPTIARESLLLLGQAARRLRVSISPFHPLAADFSPRRVDWVSGACLLIRREVIEQIGPLDEGYFMYTEETDWCYRAKRAGWEVWWLPEPIVYHAKGATAQLAYTLKRRQLYGSKVRFFRKHYGRAAAATYAALVAITSLVKTLCWSGVALAGAQSRRPVAKQHVRSYLEVLRPGTTRSEPPQTPAKSARGQAASEGRS